MNSSRRSVFGVCLGLCVAGLVLAVPLAGAAASADVQAEYRQRSAKLKPDDVAGHYQLLLWCKDQQAWNLVRKESTLILTHDPKHEQAKLLHELAARKLGERRGENRPDASSASGTGGEVGKLGRILSDAEVYRIRWMELMSEEPRPLVVRFQNRVIQRFVDAMEGKAGFTTREDRRGFMRLKPMEKLQEIRRQVRADAQDDFSKDILLKSNPKRMADFERHVLPVALNGCATANCHGDPQISRFTLYNDRIMKVNKVFTNYLIMHDYSVGSNRLIDRQDPDKSLLLTYGLRELPPGTNHTYKHPTEIPPVYRSMSDPKYRAARDWLKGLSTIAPPYGISLDSSGTTP
ncbi:MAG: hypothetical protein GY842_01035 [bacterium]|nr:hypothetical protein [bacterium]